MKKRLLLPAFLCCVSLFLGGCAATQTMISKHNLETQTKMSQSIFLNPVPDSQKVVYVRITNTSGQANFDPTPSIEALLKQKGYRITHHLSQAHYLIQANILQVGKTSQSAAQQALMGGYGSTISAAALGTAIGGLSSGSADSLIAGGIIGGVAGTVADSLVKDVVYTVITDVRISERVSNHVKLMQKTTSRLTQGTDSQSVQTSEGRTAWQRYQTRIVSTAEQVNLDFKDAVPALKLGLARAIAGLF